jgi:hypothetical protein
MKRTYIAPKMTTHGSVAEITQILGKRKRTDFVFSNGNPISDGDDLGSRDITCTPFPGNCK